MPLITDANALALEDEKKRGLVGAAQTGIPGATGDTAAGALDFSGVFGGPIQRNAIAAPGTVRDTSGLQFDPEFATINTGLQKQEADLAYGRDTGLQSAQQNYERSVQSSTAMQQAARKKLLERMSGQGILASGITGQKGAELNTAHAQYLDDLGYLKSAQEAGIEGDYVMKRNQIAGQREGLYGQQQQVQQQRQIEAARQAAEQAAQQRAAEQNRIAMEHQAQMYAQQQAAQQAMLQQIMAQQYAAPNVSAPQYAQPAAPSGPAGGVWSQADIERTRNQANKAGKGSKAGAYNYLDSMQINDPNWAAWAATTAKHYGAQNATEFLYNPYAYGLPSGAIPGVL